MPGEETGGSKGVGEEIKIFWIVALVVLVIVALVVFRLRMELKRQKKLIQEGRKIGLVFSPGKDREVLERMLFLNALRRGSNRYAHMVFRGSCAGCRAEFFDYHCQIASRRGSGHPRETEHWHHLAVLELPGSFPELLISRENLLTRAAQALGYPGIEFESREFSQTFFVRCRDRKFGYDVCHARMMEYLLENRHLTIEIEANLLALIFSGKRQAGGLIRDFRHLEEIRKLMPGYLFEAKETV